MDNGAVATGSIADRILDWVVRLVLFLRKMPRDRVAGAVASQLVRSGTSVGANYAEGQCGASRKDFAIFTRHALKSGRESEYWLQVIERSIVGLDESELRWLQNELNQLVRILFSIVSKMS